MKIKKFFFLILITALCALPSLTQAQSNESTAQSIKSAYQEHIVSPYRANWDLYLTGYTWHAGPLFAHKKLNARAYGGGLGKHWTDENGHQDLIYVFLFLDSHKDPEPIAGYARQWFIQPFRSLPALSLGAGFTAGFTARADILHYTPIPFLLPVGSIRFNKFSLMTTVIPRKRGALGLFWGRYEF